MDLLYLSRCCDNTLSVGGTFEALCEFAEQEDTHFYCI